MTIIVFNPRNLILDFLSTPIGDRFGEFFPTFITNHFPIIGGGQDSKNQLREIRRSWVRFYTNRARLYDDL